MSLKAAETGDILPWAMQALSQHGQGVYGKSDLATSANALQTWLTTVSTCDLHVPARLLQGLNDSMVRCLLAGRSAAVGSVPKHHFWAHASHRISFQGNCKYYSCFIDEGLNMVLRTCAQRAHRRHHAVRIFQLFELQGRLGLNSFLWGVPESEEDDLQRRKK